MKVSGGGGLKLSVLLALLMSWTTSATWSNMLADDDSLNECDASLQRLRDRERHTHAPYPPDFKGSWVSQQCETRPGPEFLLRHYHFDRDGSFKLLQHFYGDEWCTTPVYTLTARGQLHLREPSWIVPGGADADYTLHHVGMIAYSDEVLDQVVQRVNRSCPGHIQRPWRIRKEYVVYNYGAEESSGPVMAHQERVKKLRKRHSNGNGSKNRSEMPQKRVSHNGSHFQREDVQDTPNETLEEVDCLQAFHAVYHELQLIRSARKWRNDPRRADGSGSKRTFLFLGDVHTQLEQRASYRPTSYQPGLIRHHEIDEDCHVCRLVAKSTEKSPPHLHARPRLPVYPVGDWVSSSCETRPIGTFLLRRMKFSDHSHGFDGFYSHPTFQALFYYYTDPECSSGTLTVLASGYYSAGGDSERVQGATEFDFYIQSVSITVHDESTARNLNGLKGNRCGLDGSWKVGRMQDVTSTGGCLGLGIRVPTVANDLLKMDLNGVGHPQLYFGIAENPAEVAPPADQTSSSGRDLPLRPTSYLPPMERCRSATPGDLTGEMSNDLPLMAHARIASSSSSSAADALPRLCGRLAVLLLTAARAICGRFL